MPYRFLRAIAFAMMLFVAVSVYAAITGVISGTVTDPSGAIVPNATVVALNEQTGVKSTTVTDGKGFYSFPVLAVGFYSITTSTTGFEKFQERGIRIDANSDVRTDIKLVLGSVTQTQEVTANAVIPETQSTQVGEVISSEEMTAVPLNGRSFTDLLALQPGVSPIAVESSGAPALSGNTAVSTGNVSINGGRGASNAFMVNGGSVTDGVENSAAIVPNLDSIEEFKIITNNFDAEYGNFSGGQVNVVTKSGTNKFHGSAFEFIRNTAFNARGYSFSNPAPPKGSYDQNIFGGTIGGPIKRDKIFFFGDYQGQENTQGTTDTAVVPSAADLTGNVADWAPQFTKYGGTVQGAGWATVLTNRLGYNVTSGEPYVAAGCTTNTACVFPNYIVPTTAWDPAVSHLLKYIQGPNTTSTDASFVGGSAPTYATTAFNNTLRDNKEAARIDYVTKFGTFFAYYYMDNYHTVTPFGGGTDGGFPDGTTGRQQMANIGLTTTFKSNAVNNFRGTFVRSAIHSGNPLYTTPGPSLSSLGFVTPWSSTTGGIGNVVPGLAGVPQISITEGGSFGTPTETQARYVNSFQALDNWLKVWGLHSFSVGGNYSYNQIDERNYYDVNGGFGFSDSNETGVGFADFLLGAENGGFTQASPQILDSRSNYVGAYAEDSWRVLKNLTVNYGIRYEISTPWYDTQNKLETIIPGEQSVVFPGAPLGWVFPGDKGVSRTLGPIKYNKFAPRFGFAWSPSYSDGWLGKLTGGPGNFSIRASYGLFYSNFQDESGFVEVGDAPYGLYYQASTQTQLSTPYVNRASQVVQLAKFPFSFPPTNVSPTNPDNNICWACYEPLSSSDAIGANDTIPYVENYFLGVQRSIGKNTVITANYVGNQGRHLADSQEANPGVPATCLALDTTAKVSSSSITCGPKLESNQFTSAGGTVYNGTRILGQPNGLAFGTNPYLNTNATSNFNALEMNLKHTSHLWTGLIGYTYGKSMDDASTLTDYANPFNAKLTYALSSFNITNYLVGSGEVRLPFAQWTSNRVAKLIVGGWSVSAISKWYSGVPVAISDSEDYSLTGASGVDFPYYTPGNVRQGQHNPRVKGSLYFNTSLFTTEGKECGTTTAQKMNCWGIPGNSRRRFFAGPGSQNTDMAIIRNFHIHGSQMAEFRFEAFDFDNHSNFGAPSGSATASTFGEITSATDNRILQLAVKYHF